MLDLIFKPVIELLSYPMFSIDWLYKILILFFFKISLSASTILQVPNFLGKNFFFLKNTSVVNALVL